MKREKRSKSRRFFALLALVLALSLASEGTSAFAAQEQTRSAQGTFNHIINNMAVEPAAYGNSDDPYGYGLNTPFTMSPANELVVFGNPEPNNYRWSEFNSYDGLSYGENFLGSGTVNKTYHIYWHTDGSSYRRTINAPQAISFDPTGTGRNDHVAVLGVSIVDGGSHLYLYVYDANGNSSAEYDMGEINWMVNASGLDYYNVKNFYSITAGDYNGNGRETLVIYACLDGWNLGLYEVSVSSSGGSITMSKVKSTASYALLMDVYSDGSNASFYQLDSWVSGSDVKTKLCGQVATGDLNGDRVDDLAVLTWHGGAFVGSYDAFDPSAPYAAVSYGVKGSSASVVTKKNAGTVVKDKYLGDDTYPEQSIAAPGLAVGDIDGDGRDDVVTAGYQKLIRDGDMEYGKQSVKKSQMMIIAYQASGAELEKGPNTLQQQPDAVLHPASLMEMGFYSDDACFNYSCAAVVRLNGRGSAGYVFINGLLAEVDGQSFKYTQYSSGFTSESSNAAYYNSRKSGFSNRWIDSITVGNFDGDIEGTEEVVYSIGLKTYGKDQYRFDMGEFYGTGAFDTAVQIMNYPAANTEGKLRVDSSRELFLVVCGVDNDNDGIVARYKDKGYVYSDPEVMAIVQAAPYFEDLQDYLVDTNSTEYFLSESFELEKGTSNSVSFGAGFTHNLEGTLGGYEVTAGYAMDWSEEFTRSQTTSTSYKWQANFDDAVVVYRTPVILYRYEIMKPDGTWDADHALTISIPGPAAYEAIPVDEYNSFASYYNQYYAEQAANASPAITENIPHLDTIDDEYLGHEGDPVSYRRTSQAGYELLQSQPQTFGIGSTGTGFDWSQEAGYSTSTSMSHGFSFELTISFGLNIPGFVESGVGGYTSLEYMHGHSTTTTKTTGKGISCTVYNLDRAALRAAGLDPDEIRNNYGFSYQMARWDSNLTQTKSDEKVPIFGFVLSNVRAPESNAPAQRIFGSTRYHTSIIIAERVKELLGKSKFDNVILTIGTAFADATSGAYLSIQKNAPILMLAPDEVDGKPVANAAKYRKLVMDYVRDNLASGGTVYVLGGTLAVPEGWLSALSGLNVKRLAGSTRYGTNIEILKEAGVTGGTILVATGLNFPDSLSASAANVPILLVKGDGTDLRKEQKDFLYGLSDPVTFTVLGGEQAVSYELESSLYRYGDVTARIQGSSRYQTSVMIAERFFDSPANMLIARADEFPDGLCGGILAYLMRGPLILTNAGKQKAAREYAADYGLHTGAVLGGTGYITDYVVTNVLGQPTGTPIPVYEP